MGFSFVYFRIIHSEFLFYYSGNLVKTNRYVLLLLILINLGLGQTSANKELPFEKPYANGHHSAAGRFLHA